MSWEAMSALPSELLWHPSIEWSQILVSHYRLEFLSRMSGKIQNTETTEQASLNQFCVKSKML